MIPRLPSKACLSRVGTRLRKQCSPLLRRTNPGGFAISCIPDCVPDSWTTFEMPSLIMLVIAGRERLDWALGGAEGIRTPDLRSAIAALSHLSYSPGPARRIDLKSPQALRTRAFMAGGRGLSSQPKRPESLRLRGLLQPGDLVPDRAGPLHLTRARARPRPRALLLPGILAIAGKSSQAAKGPMRAIIDVVLIVLQALHLSADRIGGALVADRVQRRERAQSGRRHHRRVSLSHHRAAAGADPRGACRPWAGSISRPLC